MSLRQHLALASTFSAPVPSSLPCPWMPLDGLIQLWATFGNDACEVPQSVDILHATSRAFEALAEERDAFRQYLETTPARHLLPLHRQRSQSADDRRREGDTAFIDQRWSVTALHLAATHWSEVSRYLKQYAASCPQADEALQHDVHVLIAHARSQRLRVWTIAQHLLQEEVTSYRAQYGITTDLLDDEEDEGQRQGRVPASATDGAAVYPACGPGRCTQYRDANASHPAGLGENGRLVSTP